MDLYDARKFIEGLVQPAFLIRSPERVILGLNKASEVAFGYAASELIGREVRRLHADERLYHAFPAIGSDPDSGLSQVRSRFWLRHRDGTVLPTAHAVCELDIEDMRAVVLSIVRVVDSEKWRGIYHRLAQLTDRERDILSDTLRGFSAKVIARRLAISPRTVETHRGRLLEKFGVDSTFALLAQFVTADMVDGEA